MSKALKIISTTNKGLTSLGEAFIDGCTLAVSSVNWEKLGRKYGAARYQIKQSRAARQQTREHEKSYQAMNGAPKTPWLKRASFAAAMFGAGYLASEFDLFSAQSTRDHYTYPDGYFGEGVPPLPPGEFEDFHPPQLPNDGFLPDGTKPYDPFEPNRLEHDA